MKLQEFEQHYQDLKSHIDKLLLKKRAEYANSEDEGDRLSNFKQVISLFETNPAMVCMMYQSKHYASLVKICQDIDKGIYPTREILLEKAGDLVAYSFLLYAQLVELVETHNKICPVAAQEAPQAPSGPKDDSDTVSNPEGPYRASERPLTAFPEKSPLLDTSDSITKTLRPDVLDDLNLRTNL